MIRQLPRRASSWRQTKALPDFLVERDVVAIAGVDTRRLTRLVRERGALAGCIAAGDVSESDAVARAQAFPGLKGMDLAQVVTCDAPYEWQEGAWTLGQGYGAGSGERFHVVAYDFGVKRNILRLLSSRGCRITVVPATTSADAAMALKPDGVFLSNGPGDPEPCRYAIDAIAELLEASVPLFGICLGHQLLGLASGAATVKMPHGHHGANHPVQDLDTKQVVITSQNHGFAVDQESLPNCLQGHPRLAVRRHPAGRSAHRPAGLRLSGASRGQPRPPGLRLLFDHFLDLMEAARA